jgi:predicted amino acid dehydrogenase
LTRFAFIIHPLFAKDIARKYPFMKSWPDGLIETALKFKKPMATGEFKGIQSITGATTEGIFVGCPLTPNMFLKYDLNFVYDRIVQCAEIAEQEGCKLIGLGAFTSVIGDGGITVAKRSNIAVTTGNSYTVATAIEATFRACEMVDMDLASSTLAVVGATGSIGHTCATLMSPRFARTLVIGRDQERTQKVADELINATATTDVAAIRAADVVVTVTSSDTAIIMPEHLKPGAIICDVARPRDVSVKVVRERPDVLVIEGGVVKVPGDVTYGFDFGFPPGTAYACMSETMMLALEDRAESFTLGKDVSVAQVEETQRLAAKHGFKLDRFRAFDRVVDQEVIDRVRAARGEPIPA